MDNNSNPSSQLFPLPVFESLRRGQAVHIAASDSSGDSPSPPPPPPPPSPPPSLSPPVGQGRPQLPPQGVVQPILITPVENSSQPAQPVIVPQVLLQGGFVQPLVRNGENGHLEITLVVVQHYLVPQYGVVSFHMRERRSIRLLPSAVFRSN